MPVNQIPPVPVMPGAIAQDAMTKVLPQVQGQSTAPITQRAIDPSPKSDRGNKSRSNSDRGKGGKGGGDSSGRGGSVNIKV